MAGERGAQGCPSCHAALEQVPMRGVTVDRCTRCGGLWFDAGELTLSVEVLRPLDFTSGKKTELGCLRCAGSTLLGVAYPGTTVGIAACPGCKAAWLEKGKLEAIHAAVQAIVGESGKSPAGDRTAEILAELAKVQQGPLCPRCKKPLEGYTSRGQLLDRCGACGGLWFDAGELTAELGVSRKISLKDGKQTAYACPRCPNKTLVAVTYPKTTVAIEVCPDCRGTLLDPKRLDEVREAILGGSSPG